MGLQRQAAFILKEVNPQLFLILSVWVMLLGLGLLALAAYLILKHPEELKRSRWLRRYKDTDWVQYLAGGVFFIALGGVSLLSALNRPGREFSYIEEGLVRGLFIAALVAFILALIAKAVEKFNEK